MNTPTIPMYPRRGDEYDVWLKAKRDSYRHGSREWLGWDRRLDEHREKADYGLRYDQQGGDP